jgi:photosystem II stability/assembly factor-like uncharacterized protein
MKKLIYISIIIITFCSASYSQVYNWFPVNSGTTNNLNCINGTYIVGANGTLLASSNSGNNWYTVPLGTMNELKSIVSNSASNIIIVGSSGTVVRSTNGGTNWSIIPSGVSNNLNSVARAAANYYYAAGSSGKIISTSNNGDNWVSLSSGVSTDLNSIYGIAFYSWTVGNNGVILYTSNWGTTWTPQTSGTTANLNSITFQNNTGFIVGNNGTILRSTNLGTNWTPVSSGTNANLRSFINASWIAGDGGTVLRSTNTGLNWTTQNIGTNVDFNSVYSTGGEVAWVVGKNGKIYQRMYDSLFSNWKLFTPNNTGTIITNTGIFNQDIRLSNHPGFEWPLGSGKYAIFSSGLCIGAKYNGVLREAMGSYKGEYRPGYIEDSAGIPVARTDNRFRIYSVKRGDNAGTNQDWAQWGQMVPFGAPYADVNHNNQYKPAIDTPGIKGASQTIFLCMTDGYQSTHTLGEGFGGGTLPLYAEVHLIAWGFDDKPHLENVQFLKWDVINKSKVQWQSAYFSIYNDVDLGGSDDDFIGCDTNRGLGYCYNGDNNDEGLYGYGINPPAVGIQFLNCFPGYASLSSFGFALCTGCGAPWCETAPNGEPEGAYNFMKGLKKDGTPWVIPPGGSSNLITKYIFPGDPESGQGWDEFDGRIGNCGNSLSGPFIPGTPFDRRFHMSYGSENKILNPNDTQKVLIAQFMARGSNNLNSVTRLKLLSDTIRMMCDNGAIFGVKEITSQVPAEYKLYQNYPNPFNPSTIINYQLAMSSEVKLVIYDVTGREVVQLVNQKQNAGSYQIEWDGSNYPSGVYFYQLKVNEYSDTKKMVLLK